MYKFTGIITYKVGDIIHKYIFNKEGFSRVEFEIELAFKLKMLEKTYNVISVKVLEEEKDFTVY